MDIIRNSVWLSQGTDLLAEGLYRVLDFDKKVDLLILFKKNKKERVSQFLSHFHCLNIILNQIA